MRYCSSASVVCREYELGEFVSPVFTTSKQDGSHRLMLNLKQFNQCVQYIHFKMEGLSDVLNMVRPGIWMASVDLRDAYYEEHSMYYFPSDNFGLLYQ